MGVSIEQWRACIGTFSALGGLGRTLIEPTTELSAINLMLLPLLLVCILLVCSGVEPNPGPGVFSCRSCNSEFTSLRSYVDHQGVHCSDKNFKFPCVFEGCKSMWTNLASCRVHIARDHKKYIDQQSAAGNIGDVLSLQTKFLTCPSPLCKQLLSSKKEVMLHFADHLNRGMEMDCPFPNCMNKYKKTTTFRSHVSFRHKHDDPVYTTQVQEEVVLDIPASSSSSCPLIPEELVDLPQPMEADILGDESEDDLLFENNIDDDIYPYDLVKEQVAKFYLKLEGSLLLASSTVQIISHEVALLSKMSHHCLKRALLKELRAADIPKEKIDCIISETFECDPIFNVHVKGSDYDNLSTIHLRQKFFNSHFPYVAPEEIVLDNNSAGKKTVAHKMPVRKALEVVLSDPSVQIHVENSFQAKQSVLCDDKIFQDYTDGSAYETHKEKCPKNCIQLIFYQDGFEFSPFGPAKGVYKCVGFYYTIGNLPPEYRSKVDYIFMSYLVKDNDLRKLGLEHCLKPLVDELKELATNGIKFKDEIVPVCLMFFTGDNLGAHQIGGFVESFSASHFCRFCPVSNNAFLKDPWISLPLRMENDYEKCLTEFRVKINAFNRARNLKAQRKRHKAALKASMKLTQRKRAPAQKKLPQTLAFVKKSLAIGKEPTHIKGVKRASPLNSIPNFHVCSPPLPPCLAHDLFEGVFSVVLAKILQSLIKKGWFTLETLNRRTKMFKCCKTDSADAPTPLKSFKNLGGHACENWTLIRLLPFIIQGLIQDPNDKAWALYLMLKDICEFICAPKISMAQLAYMKILIERFLCCVKESFPVCLIPKAHFLVHYPELITVFGPLIRLWTMRFESKHVFFKTVAKVCKNFINITFTLSQKYQQRFAYNHSGGKFLPDDIHFEPRHSMDFCTVDEQMKSLLKEKDLSSTDLTVLSQVVVKGVTYNIGVWLVLSGSEPGSENLVVGHVRKILHCQSSATVYFLVEHHVAENSFQGYYIIQEEANAPTSIRELEELVDYYPLSSYKMDGKKAISLKHSVICMK